VRLLAAAAFAAAAVVAAPAHAAPEAPAATCSRMAPGKPMLTCLLDGAEALLKAGPGKDPEYVAALWVRLSEVSAQAGDLPRARRSADRISAGGQRRLAEGRVAVLMARNGDTAGAAAILDAMQKQPLPVGQVDWAAAGVLAALNDPARTRSWLDSLPPDRKVDGLLALVRAQQQAKRPQEAERLLKDFGNAVGAAGEENTAIIVHAPTALDFIAAGRLDAANRMLPLLPDMDRGRVKARLALKLDQQGKRAEAQAALDALVALPRSSDARLARAVLAARHGDFEGAQKVFPPSLAYDQALVDELFAAMARGGQDARLVAMAGTMNNSRDKAATWARLALSLAKEGKAKEATSYLRRARAILDPLVELPHGAAALLIDFSQALGNTAEAMVALGYDDAGRVFTKKLEDAVQTDPYGLARPGVMSALIATNKALFKGMLDRKDPGGVRRLMTQNWRVAAGLAAYLDVGLVSEAALIAERESHDPLTKTGDFLSVAQYIAKQ
jgi:tetratricopeptide (TPR) repeat protein